MRDGQWRDLPAVRGQGRGYGTAERDREAWVYSDKNQRTMTATEEMGVVIKVMHLLREGRIDRTTKNIDVLRMIKTMYDKE